MPAFELSTAERRGLRAQAHHLDPVVMIGNDGLTPAVAKEIGLALDAHGLIKVRMFSDDRAE
ncbi:MAG: YhbY family RNA-binding protein, partial [Burkholderiaceae bacterium]|nr:YhbY family RNA-binding protein [Burkholderiaceae bacterium]